ncbi:ABC transporter ATP-binding protein [Halomicrococcus sp. SG-WS-1]|uniref:ABC transporter ATP-binding protein n=1 Tax=Halomicrococcus sp. SG-WS-1 TaxID=3439057 RepID=UPI003F7ACFA5
MTTVLETRNLTKEFGALRAVDDVSVAVDSEDVTSIIGPNGAGKTTFYHLLSGRLAPTDGEVFLRPRAGEGLERITGLPPHEISRSGLSRAYQINNSFEGLTVLDNVRTARISAEGRSLDFRTRVADDEALRERTREVLELVDLTGIAEMKCSNLSHGDKRKVEIGLALATDPSVILLDEPTAGMNPSESEHMVDLIERLNAETETTFVLTEHDIEMVLSISDRILVLHRGELIADGTPREIMEDEQVTSAYLGEKA